MTRDDEKHAVFAGMTCIVLVMVGCSLLYWVADWWLG